MKALLVTQIHWTWKCSDLKTCVLPAKVAIQTCNFLLKFCTVIFIFLRHCFEKEIIRSAEKLHACG